jgi:hypothetical protein
VVDDLVARRGGGETAARKHEMSKNRLVFGRWLQGLGVTLVLAGAAVGCADGDRIDARLDVAAPSAEEQRSEEEEWLRKQQMIRVTLLDSNGEVVSQGPGGTPSQLIFTLFHACQQSNPFLSPPSATSCESTLEDSYDQLCYARTFLAIASAQAEPVRVTQENGYQYVYDQVTDEAAAVLAQEAATYSAGVLDSMVASLRNPSALCKNASNVWSKIGGSSAALTIARTAGEAYYLGLAAFERAIETTLNASDKLRSSSLSPTLAAQRAISGSSLSRAAAAHLLVGGTPGIAGDTLKPLCTSPDLTPQARSALTLLRDSGVNPTLLAAANINDLLDGTSTEGSVRQRLGQFRSIPSLTSGAPVAGHYDLSSADFDAARRYLLEEINAFSRSPTAQLPAPVTDGYKRYAGVATEPAPLPEGAWAARASYRTSEPTFGFVNASDLRQFIATSHVAVGHVLKSTDTFAGTGETSSTIRTELFGGLSTLISAREYRGVFRIRYEAGTGLNAIGYGLNSANRLRVVVGEDGLRCAVQGNIEGASCVDPPNTPDNVRFPCPATEAPSLECLTAVRLDTDGVPGSTSQNNYGFTIHVEKTRLLTGNGFNITQWIDNKTRLYLVQPKTATSPELPGHYEVLAGTNLYATNVSQYLPIVPTVDARVDQVLAPSRAFCTVPEVSCAGVRMDARLPLEDELTDDGDGVESSWKHYLALARQAANEADLYGREYVSNALAATSTQGELEVRKEEQQQQAEALLQEVQDLCGTTIDSRALLKELSTTGDNLGIVFFSGLTNCTTKPGYRYVPGAGCILDLAKILQALPNSPDAQRLSECLAGENEPFVSLGEKPLCLGYNAANPNEVCPPRSGWTCPTVEKDNGSCPTIPPPNPNAVPPDTLTITAARTEPLGYFKQTSPSKVPGACAAFRRARTGHVWEDVMELIASNALHPDHLKEYITELSWNAKYGGYAGISMGDVERYASGDLTYGNRPGWPCSASPGCDSTTSAGFFCQTANCTSQADRGKFNHRMLRATAAANFILGLQGEAGMKAMLPSKPVFPDGLNGHDGDPCGHMVSSVSVPSDWFTFDGDHVQYWMKSDPLWEGATPIRHCSARLVATSALRTDAPIGRDGYSSFERETTQPGTAWITNNGTVISSQLGSRFALKSGFLKINSTIPESEIESLFLGALSQAQFTGNQHWTRFVLDGHQEPTAPVFRDTAINANFFLYNPSDPTPSTDYYTPFLTTLSGEDLLDGVELLCELAVNHHQAKATMPPVVSATLESVEVAGHLVEQLAQNIVDQGSMTIFARVPKVAMDALRETSAVGAFPAIGGQMAQAVSDLRLALLSTRESLPIVSGAMRQLGAEMKAYRAQVEIAQLQEQSIDLSLLSSTLDRFTRCATSVVGIDFDNPLGGAAVAGIECANAAAQIAIAMNASLVEKQIVDANLEVTRQSFITRVAQLASNIESASVGLSEAFENIDRSLAGIESLRKSAQNTIARALYTASYQSSKQADYARGLGTVAREYQERYKRSLKNAKLMTFFAKRSIEQRLGIRLSEMRDDLPLVEAPATWEGELCTTVTKLEVPMPGASDQPNYASYVGGDVSEYITKLENLVESYRVEHNFQTGDDIAVISLRDDVLNVRAPCTTKSRNLFAASGRLGSGHWAPSGCRPVTIGANTFSAYNCVSAMSLGETALPGRINPINGAMGYELQFGDGTASCPSTSGSTCGFQTGAALVQTLKLVPGWYRFSWYTKEFDLAGGSNYGVAVIRPLAGAAPVNNFGFTATPSSSPGPWRRVWADFRIEANSSTTDIPGDYEIGFTAGGALTETVTVAAPMLEKLPNDDTAVIVGTFQNTDEEGNVRLAVCEDTSGEYFRADKWRRECVHLCDAGFSSNCTNGPEYCYHELSFGVSQRWIESGKLFNFSGFARGNFNYRIDAVALNFVGSNVRNCENSDTPSTCYSGGFVPYSVEHNGPFFVRTHDGRDFRAHLFDGRIEHARGLAAERYLTNPLSSTDRDLLTDYMRSELQGRPLDGNFTIRVWDEPGVDFNAIEDIQLVLKYKYWTRFE